jgi:putative spermidine/putrescine transport system permease protein
MKYNMTNNHKHPPHMTLAQHGIAASLWLARFAITLFLILPVLIFIPYAFSKRWFYPDIIPATWTVEPFLDRITNDHTLSALWLSFLIAVLVTGVSLLVAYPAARTLGLHPIRGKPVILLLLFLPTVVPPITTGMGLNILFLKVGLAGTMVGVILVHLIPVLPYTVFSLTSVFARYDPTYEHQALVLGAGRLRIFFTITLPMILPGLVVAALFAFLISWSDYLLTLFLGSGQVLTLPILLFSTAAGGNPTTIAALSLLFIAPPILCIVLAARTIGHHMIPGQSWNY